MTGDGGPSLAIPVAELTACRRELASAIKWIDNFLLAPANTPEDSANHCDADWIDLPAAAKRFGMKQDTLRNWCRDTRKYPGLGRKPCDRWLVNIKRLRELRG